MRRRGGCLVGWLVVLAPLLHAESPELSFALEKWKPQEFSRLAKTSYTLEDLDGQAVMHAQANESASGLVFKQDIDLTATPLMKWSWKVDKGLQKLDEQTREGDDYVARIYVVFKTKWNQIKPNTIAYVWSGNTEAPKQYVSPYTEKAVMIPVNRGGEGIGIWQSHQRNIRADIKACFGVEVKKLLAVALMTDTDNSKQQAEAWYGDIQFVTE